LPVILNTDELPKAPDELPFEELEEEAPSAAAGSAVVPAPTVGSAPAQGEDIPAVAPAAPAAATQTWATGAGATQPAARATGTSHASVRTEAESPKRATPSVPSAVPSAVPSTVAARRETPQRAKPATSADDCNPPYFFDANNIRRLKLECL
jgi:hypothetical protein